MKHDETEKVNRAAHDARCLSTNATTRAIIFAALDEHFVIVIRVREDEELLGSPCRTEKRARLGRGDNAVSLTRDEERRARNATDPVYRRKPIDEHHPHRQKRIVVPAGVGRRVNGDRRMSAEGGCSAARRTATPRPSDSPK